MSQHITSHDSERLAEGQQVITVCAMIVRDGPSGPEVFLPKRAATKKFLPGVYELPGGHVDFGEELEAALRREIREEFGVEVVIGEPFAAFTYVNEIKRAHAVEIVYFARFADPNAILQLNPQEHETAGWFNHETLRLAATATKGMDDVEFQIIQKGFGMLRSGDATPVRHHAGDSGRRKHGAMSILFATRNARKLGEARLGCQLFGLSIEQADVVFHEIQSKDPVEIAVHKSRQAFDQLREPVVVADTFWTIPALNGFPGAYMKEVTRWFGPQDFINLLQPYQDKRVCFTETVVYRDDDRHRIFPRGVLGRHQPNTAWAGHRH